MTKILITLAVLTTITIACIAPIKPIPPVGCNYNDAVLMCDNHCNCKWVWINCGRY
jgi:hypothetical protein